MCASVSHMEKIICYTDGGARGNPGPAGAGAVIVRADGKVLSEVSQFLGNATNNFAEYAAVLLVLKTLKKQFGAKTKSMAFEIKLDSELIQRQLAHVYQVKEPGLVPQFMEIHNMRVKDFPHLTFTHVPRAQNKDADRLANVAMDRGY